MEKKRLFQILSRAQRSDVIRLGKMLQQQYPVTIVKKPEKSLTMIRMREPVKNSLFYLGEAIITEAVVSLGDTVGTAVTMGDDFEKTLHMAIIDAAEIKAYLRRKICCWNGNRHSSERSHRRMPCSRKPGGFSFHGFGGGTMKTLHQFDEVFDTQAVFRLLLDAMSNPPRTVSVAAQRKAVRRLRRISGAGHDPAGQQGHFFSVVKMNLLKKDLQLVYTSPQEVPVPDADYRFCDRCTDAVCGSGAGEMRYADRSAPERLTADP